MISFAILLASKQEGEVELGFTGSLVELLKDEQDDENVYRFVMAFGTLVSEIPLEYVALKKVLTSQTRSHNQAHVVKLEKSWMLKQKLNVYNPRKLDKSVCKEQLLKSFNCWLEKCLLKKYD